MKISIIVEGTCEKIFINDYLRPFLKNHLREQTPKLMAIVQGGRLPKEDFLRRLVERCLTEADHVIALTDVYTGTNPPDFRDASDAKDQMRQWVGKNPNFHPHAAQYEFEAWLLPYWSTTIQELTNHNRALPSSEPETINHGKPPSHWIKEVFRNSRRGSYPKVTYTHKILKANDLTLAIQRCPELKSFVNTIIRICNGVIIP